MADVLTPAEVFCLECGPDTLLDRENMGRDGDIAVLRCPRCAAEQRVPVMPLFVVAGPSGAGKSTVTGPLRRLLPECVVFDADLTWHIASAGHDNWRNTWLQLAYGIAQGGRATVLCGSLTPDQLERLPFRRERISPCFDTGAAEPAETAAQVAAWVRDALSSPRS